MRSQPQRLGVGKDAVADWASHAGLSPSVQAILNVAAAFEADQDAQLADLLRRLWDVASESVGAAALSAFITEQLGWTDGHPMAPQAAKMVRSYDADPEIVAAISAHLDQVEFVFEPDGQSLVGGAQGMVDSAFRAAPAGRAFSQTVHEAINTYRRDALAVMPNQLLRVEEANIQLQAWFTRVPSGGKHSAHIHQSGRVSGSLYLQAPTSKAETPEGALEFGSFSLGQTARLETEVRARVVPKPGRMVLFPSCLAHRTVPVQSGPDRVTLSFDVLPLECGGVQQ